MLTRNDIAEATRALIDDDAYYLNVVWSIVEFNRVFEVNPNPELYANLVCEEVNEWVEELVLNGYGYNLLKETIDVIYVLEGLLNANPDDEIEITQDTMERLQGAVEIIEDLIEPVITSLFSGFQIDRGFREVHRSNMSKLGLDGKPVRREDNKVLKGPNYSPADMSEIMVSPEMLIEHLKV